MADLAVQVGVTAVVAGCYTVRSGLRRVAPADIIEGNVVSVRNDKSGNHLATIEYIDRAGVRQKWFTTMNSHPSLGETVPLFFPAGKKTPTLLIPRTLAITSGIVFIVLGAVITVGRFIVYKG